MPKINKIHARQVFNSRGDPTIETEVSLDDGSKASAIVYARKLKKDYGIKAVYDNLNKKFLYNDYLTWKLRLNFII